MRALTSPRNYLATLLIATLLAFTGLELFQPQVLAATNLTDCTEQGLKNALAVGGSITFGCSGTITLTTTPSAGIVIATNTSLDATGQNVTINGANNKRIFTVNLAVSFSLKGLTLTGGKTGGTEAGGAINNNGTLSLTKVTISNSSANEGGAINNLGTLNISTSTFSGNSAANSGGAIINGGILTITDSTFSGNSAANSGGAIDHMTDNLVITGSTFSDNTAGAVGGAILNDGVAHVTNTTFSANAAAPTNGGKGGAIYNAWQIVFSHVTFANNTANQGGGLYLDLGTGTTLENSLIANSPNGQNCTGVINIIRGGNLQWPGTSCGATILSQDPKLGALADNGGPTRTHLLQTGSAAIDLGQFSLCVGKDQRGNPRPVGPSCDSGAVEVGLTLVPIEVTQPNDRGMLLDGNVTGTLSNALKNAASGQTIVFNLTGGANTVRVSGELPPLKAGVRIQGECINGRPSIIIDGSGTTGVVRGLVLVGLNSLSGIELRGFRGKLLTVSGKGNQLRCSKADR
jgi:predicted outer membrane repeat protein